MGYIKECDYILFCAFVCDANKTQGLFKPIVEKSFINSPNEYRLHCMKGNAHNNTLLKRKIQYNTYLNCACAKQMLISEVFADYITIRHECYLQADTGKKTSKITGTAIIGVLASAFYSQLLPVPLIRRSLKIAKATV